MTRRRKLWAAALVLAVALAGVILVLSRDDDDPQVATTTTTTTIATTTTTVLSSTTTAPGGPITSEEAASVVWPDPGATQRYGDPVQAARAFAVDLVGFRDPLVGAFQPGDSRSGEVQVRSRASGPVTTVLVRRLSDGSWWVLGASSPNIRLDSPIAGQAIDHPLQLAGSARAFEGTVQVSVFRRGSTRPLGEGFVTGSGGTQLGPFRGEVAWENPGGGWGSVLLYTSSAEDGRVDEAMAIPVGFIGGD